MSILPDRRKSACRVFISYRRESGIDIARGVHDQLKNRGYSVFLDTEGLRAGAFNRALYHEIENSDVFLLILSHGSLDRCWNENDWVRQEIAHAIRNKLLIIPIMKEGFNFPAELPADVELVRYAQGIRLSYDFYDAFMEKLEDYMSGVRKKKDPRKKCPLILCAAALLTAVALWAVMAFGGADTAVLSGNSQTNLCEGGVVSQVKEGTVKYMLSTDTRWLNSFAQDDTNYFYQISTRSIVMQWKEGEDTLWQNVDCRYLYATPEWLYCLADQEGVGTLYRAENDITGHTVGAWETVVENVLSHNGVVITDESIYYFVQGEGGGLYACSTDGTGPRLLFDNGGASSFFGWMLFHASDEDVYFWVSTGGIYTVPVQGGIARHLVNTRDQEGVPTHAVLCGEKIYYVLEKQGIDGSAKPAEIWCADPGRGDKRLAAALDSADMEVRVLNSLDDNLFMLIHSGSADGIYALYSDRDALMLLREFT